jgi:CHAT domain-containing protein/tetratricopeptide (TPR) repeat protein
MPISRWSCLSVVLLALPMAPISLAIDPTINPALAAELLEDPSYKAAQTRNDQALALARQGKYPEAIARFEQSLAFYRSAHNRPLEGIMLHSLGSMYRELDQHDKALGLYQQAWAILQTEGDLNWQSLVLRMLGSTYLEVGQYGEALQAYNQALQTDRKMGDQQREGRSLNALGIIYSNLGQHRKALGFYQDALKIFQTLNNPEEEEKALSNIAVAQDRLHNPTAAIAAYQKSLQILDKLLIDNPRNQRFHLQSQAEVLDNLGFAYVGEKQFDAAETAYQKALAVFRQLQQRNGEARVLSHLAFIATQRHQDAKALTLQQQSLALRRATNDPVGKAFSLTALGEIWLRQGQLDQAEAALREAVGIWESLRPGLADNDKISFFETVSETYDVLQQVLVRRGRSGAALEIAEQGRARALAELLADRRKSASPSPSPVLPAPKLAELRAIAAAQQATLVEYSLPSDGEIYIWVIPPTGEITFKRVTRPASAPPIRQLVADSRSLLGARGRASIQIIETRPGPTRPLTGDLRQLHELLIAPIADRLPTDPQQRVIFLPQGSLFLVPFAALQDSQGNYLIQQHTIAIAPSIQTLALTQKLQRPGDPQATARHLTPALIVGDPTMPQLPDLKLAPLPGARQEALDIGKLLHSPALVGGAATKAAVLKEMTGARLVHLATHGLLERRAGQIPGAIALAPSGTDSGLLTANEIAKLKLSADLVVLSACDTGRGDITGEGVVGLSRTFVSAGVPSVVVSLWAVPDAPTRQLMTAFYGHLQSGRGLDKAQALRQAMLDTMRQHPNPVDWAAFTLVGESQ